MTAIEKLIDCSARLTKAAQECASGEKKNDLSWMICEIHAILHRVIYCIMLLEKERKK